MEQQQYDAEAQTPEPKQPEQRLCTEIQLFDLCELERCNFKSTRYCTNPELLQRFEQIEEREETRCPTATDDDEEWLDDDDYPDDLDDDYQDDEGMYDDQEP